MDSNLSQSERENIRPNVKDRTQLLNENLLSFPHTRLRNCHMGLEECGPGSGVGSAQSRTCTFSMILRPLGSN